MFEKCDAPSLIIEQLNNHHNPSLLISDQNIIIITICYPVMTSAVTYHTFMQMLAKSIHSLRTGDRPVLNSLQNPKVTKRE